MKYGIQAAYVGSFIIANIAKHCTRVVGRYKDLSNWIMISEYKDRYLNAIAKMRSKVGRGDGSCDTIDAIKSFEVFRKEEVL